MASGLLLLIWMIGVSGEDVILHVRCIGGSRLGLVEERAATVSEEGGKGKRKGMEVAKCVENPVQWPRARQSVLFRSILATNPRLIHIT